MILQATLGLIQTNTNMGEPESSWNEVLLRRCEKSMVEYLNGSQPYMTFAHLLHELCTITGSHYGFIVEKCENKSIQFCASILPRPEALESGDRHFSLLTETPRLINTHTSILIPSVAGTMLSFPFDSLLSVPVMYGIEMIGEICICNRSEYTVSMIDTLLPFSNYCGQLIMMYRKLFAKNSHARPKCIVEEKARYLALLSHEIRNPLQIISSGVQIINDALHVSPNSDLTLLENVSAQVTSAVDTLQKLINDISELNHLEAGDFTINNRTFAVSNLFEKAYESVKHLKSKNVELQSSVDTCVPALVIGDSSKIQTILSSLLSNVLKHTSNGSITIACHYNSCQNRTNQIPLIGADIRDHNSPLQFIPPGLSPTSPPSSFPDSSTDTAPLSDISKNSMILCSSPKTSSRRLSSTRMLTFEVVDTGTGISPSEIGKLFYTYSQLENPSALFSEKMGLGLIIAKKLCNEMGGDVGVCSQLGRGSCFVFSVPVSIPSPSNIGRAPLGAISGEIHPLETGKLAGKRILIVDDNKSIRHVLCGMLAREQCICYEAENGERAIEMVKGTEVDAILLDCLMPVKDGYETATQLRSKGYEIPIIAITGNSSTNDADRCEKCGFDAFLTKPVKKSELISKILQSFVKRKRTVPRAVSTH